MKKTHVLWSALLAAVLLSSCSSHRSLVSNGAPASRAQHPVTHIQRDWIVIDSRYDAAPDAAALAILAPYKQKVDSVMSPVVGAVASDMYVRQPEGTLSNLLADILIWAGAQYGEEPVLSVYNMGGIRTDLAVGPVTRGDLIDVAPFDNKIVFLTLTGSDLLELFRQIAVRGGDGVSHGVQLVITSDGRLLSARLHGQSIDPSATYRVVTLDYLAQGNDGLTAFTRGTDLSSPGTADDIVRFVIMRYLQEQAAQGRPVTSRIEGRIVLSE